jgi:hypothetical protein
MEKRIMFFGVFSVGMLAGAIACTTTTTEVAEPTTDGGKEGSTATKEAGTSSSSGATSSSGSTGDPDDECATKSADDCTDCCAGNHKAGAQTLTKAVIACGCNGTGATAADGGAGDAGAGDAGAEGPCATECETTICASTPKQPDATCNTCLTKAIGQGGACAKYASDTCLADDDCKAAQECLGACPK